MNALLQLFPCMTIEKITMNFLHPNYRIFLFKSHADQFNLLGALDPYKTVFEIPSNLVRFESFLGHS